MGHQKHSTRVRGTTMLAAALVGLALAQPAGAQEPAKAEEPYVARTDAGGVQRAEVLAGSYFFRPRHVIVKAGVPVELTVIEEPGIVPHSIVIDAPAAGIRVDEPLGTTPRKITFTPAAPGRYPFWCKEKFLFFPSHREEGMEGVLEVVP